MKLTAKKYAQALVQVLTELSSEKKEVDIKTVAKHFMEMLIRRRQTKLLSSILIHIETEWCKAQGITRIEIEYAPKFKDALEVLQKALHSAKILVHAKSREDLIGGYRIKVDDTLIDASLQGRLNALSHKLRT